MAWPYHFVDLSHKQKLARRTLLDRYGVYAQLSAFIPILAFLLFRLGTWISSERKREKDYSAVPTSPALKRQRETRKAGLVTGWRRLVWWLEGNVAGSWGVRGRWIAGLSWGIWLLFLCVHQTGDDYLHLTKRFGEVAISQFPMHYMLSMKTLYSPLALVFNSSHEELNPWHRLSGRIIYSILILHAIFYLNYFFQVGVLLKRITSLDVIIGLLAITALTIISTTSLAFVRRWSYRLFFVLHLIIGVSILPLLFFHASHLRIYVIESLGIFIIDIILRKIDTTTGFATITSVPHTKLIKIKVPIPNHKLDRFQSAPGQHVYLSLPAESTPQSTTTPSIHSLLFNPFTVADVTTRDITLILRTLSGPTTLALSNLSQLSKARPPISIEGPLGSSHRFTNLASRYDRILIIAGGVGGTFAVPLYKYIREQFEIESRTSERLSLVWTMRSAAEAAWATDLDPHSRIDDDEQVRIFLTGDKDVRSGQEPVDGSVELEDLRHEGVEPDGGIVKATGGYERPDLRVIVDDAFKGGNEERVAVLVCGPGGMAAEVRRAVGKWVGKGREVWFHEEGFGW